MNTKATQSRKTRAWVPILAALVVIFGALFMGRGTIDQSIEGTSARIASNIRCAVCHGLSVSESAAPSARAIYDEIIRRVQAGESEQKVQAYIISRYGSQLILRPSSSGSSSIVWIAPVVLGVLALAAIGWKVQGSRVNIAGTELSELDSALVNRARRTYSKQTKESDVEQS